MTTAVEVRPVWVTAEMAAVHLQWLGFLVSPTTIRVWAHRGHIRADGPRGSRYELSSVQEWADQQKSRPT